MATSDVQRTVSLNTDLDKLAQDLQKSDKYMFRLLPIIKAYCNKIPVTALSVKVTIENPVTKGDEPQQIIVNMVQWMAVQIHTRPQPLKDDLKDQNDVQNDPKVELAKQMALLYIEAVVYHSSNITSMIQNTLDSRDTFPGRVMKHLRSFKSQLLKFAGLLEKTLVCYTNPLNNMSRPSIEAIQEALNIVKSALKPMKAEELQNLFEKECTLYLSQEHFLCSILGLKASCGDKLRTLPREIRDRQLDWYWIDQMLEEAYMYEVKQEDPIADQLSTMGFTESRAPLIAQMINDTKYKDHQNILYWAKKFIKDCWKYDILLNDEKDFPPLRELEKQYDFMVDTEDRIGEHVTLAKKLHVRYTHLNYSKEIPKSVSERFSDDETYRFFFHGTDHRSATDIVVNGIRLGMGQPMQDLSDGKGFYLTSCLQASLDWAKWGRFTTDVAVIAFKIPCEVLNTFKKIDLQNDDEKWEDVIRYNRTGRDRRIFKPNKQIKSDCQKADFVDADASIDGARLSSESAQISTLSIRKDNCKQICILSEKMAEAVGALRNIDSVLYFVECPMSS